MWGIVWLILILPMFIPTIFNYKKFGFPPAFVWIPWIVCSWLFTLMLKLIWI